MLAPLNLVDDNRIVNPLHIDQLLQLDDTFKIIRDKYGDPPQWSRPQGFVSLCKIILEQQVSLASANAHFQKLSNYVRDFTPSNILKLSDDELRSCQISRQKSRYIKDLSEAILLQTLDLNIMADLSEPEIRVQLTGIKGIGNWTADIYLLFCLQHKDIFPIGDIAVVNTLKELTAANTKNEMLQLSEKWRPFRSLATFFLWHYYLCKRNRQVSL